MKFQRFKKLASFMAISLALTACEDIPTVSILSETEDFVQAASEVNNKIDILWVVDNSGSMYDSQAALASNFEAFIADLESKSYDFQIAVIGTDAYRGGYFAKFKDAAGTAILTGNTPNLREAFIHNVLLGTGGSANERGGQSIEAAFNHPDNQALDFPRKDAFLSVIIVSDEDDNSRNESHLYPGTPYYQALLDDIRLGDTLAGEQNYSVNAIVRLPENAGCTSGVNGLKYIDLVQATGGIVADICSDFATSLTEITVSIVQLSTQFYLKREPVVESIRVIVNDIDVPQDTENGWEYIAESNSIIFHGSAVPEQGASILVDFDPVKLKN